MVSCAALPRRPRGLPALAELRERQWGCAEGRQAGLGSERWDQGQRGALKERDALGTPASPYPKKHCLEAGVAKRRARLRANGPVTAMRQPPLYAGDSGVICFR